MDMAKKELNIKEMIEEIEEILKTFSGNTFIVPSSWSDKRQFSGLNSTFETYMNERRDYFTFKISNPELINFGIKKEYRTIDTTIANIGTSHINITPIFKLEENVQSFTQIEIVLFFLKEMYNEVYSLNINNTER